MKVPLFEAQKEWVEPEDFPDLRSYDEIAVDLETRDPDLTKKGSGLEAIRAVANGQSILGSSVTERALRWLRGLHDLPATPGTDQLSSQEERVVALVSEGKTNKEIAVTLGLSDKTVKNYLANVFQKLRITRRAQAAAFFVKRRG